MKVLAFRRSLLGGGVRGGGGGRISKLVVGFTGFLGSGISQPWV